MVIIIVVTVVVFLEVFALICTVRADICVVEAINQYQSPYGLLLTGLTYALRSRRCDERAWCSCRNIPTSCERVQRHLDQYMLPVAIPESNAHRVGLEAIHHRKISDL